jgi:hypothetical protein
VSGTENEVARRGACDTAAGLETIARFPEAHPVVAQLSVLQKLIGQAAETVEGFATTLRDAPAS